MMVDGWMEEGWSDGVVEWWMSLDNNAFRSFSQLCDTSIHACMDDWLHDVGEALHVFFILSR